MPFIQGIANLNNSIFDSSDDDDILTPNASDQEATSATMSDKYFALRDAVMTQTRQILATSKAEADNRAKDKAAQHAAELVARDADEQAKSKQTQKLLDKLQAMQREHEKEICELAKELNTLTVDHNEAIANVKADLRAAFDREHECSECGTYYCGVYSEQMDDLSEHLRDADATVRTFDNTHARAIALVSQVIALKIDKHRAETDSLIAEHTKTMKRVPNKASKNDDIKVGGAKVDNILEAARKHSEQNKIDAMSKIFDKYKL